MSGTYPSFKQLEVSDRDPVKTTEWMLSINGTQLGVDLGDRERFRWRITHILDASDWATLEALFESNQSTSGAGNGTVTFTDQMEEPTSPATTYTVEFAARPKRRKIAPGLFEVEVELVEAI